jgi:hypothetical protein
LKEDYPFSGGGEIIKKGIPPSRGRKFEGNHFLKG